VFTATAAVNPRTLERFITFSTRETLFNVNGGGCKPACMHAAACVAQYILC
jgi:hypothetical protein